MKTRISSTKSVVRNIFKREQKFTNQCKICSLEFSDPERTKKYMIKAHSKPKREK
ncbi:MAG: hypothetical protein ACE5DL_02525 [Nitrosopumilaceae archaeon]